MGLRFRKRIKIAPGVSVNLSGSGARWSFGPRGAKYTVGNGRRRTTVGIPGSGVHYTEMSRADATRDESGGSTIGAVWRMVLALVELAVLVVLVFGAVFLLA